MVPPSDVCWLINPISYSYIYHRKLSWGLHPVDYGLTLKLYNSPVSCAFFPRKICGKRQKKKHHGITKVPQNTTAESFDAFNQSKNFFADTNQRLFMRMENQKMLGSQE
jgi:hypothetical protein